MQKIQVKKGEVVIARLDFNVPIGEMKGKETVLETFRIDEALPTILNLQKKNTKTIVLAHLEKGSLLPVFAYLKKKVKKIFFVEADIEKIKIALGKLKEGEVLLVDNIRNFKGEKENDLVLAKSFADLATVYINDAFSASHRKHMSLLALPTVMKKQKKKVFSGNLIQKEVKELTKALKPKTPFLFILGGAKFETKLALLNKFAKSADAIFVGGALAHNFFIEKGQEVGVSLKDNEVKLDKKIVNNKKIILPSDVLVETNNVKLLGEISKEDRIVDFGPTTLSILKEKIKKSKTVVWNGPLGFYEKGFDKGTVELLKFLGEQKGKVIILGGGDTTAVLQKMKKKNLKFTHVSTGGGAMIDFLSSGNLPAIKVLS